MKWEAYRLCKEGEGEMGSLLFVQRRRRGNGKLVVNSVIILVSSYALVLIIS